MPLGRCSDMKCGDRKAFAILCDASCAFLVLGDVASEDNVVGTIADGMVACFRFALCLAACLTSLNSLAPLAVRGDTVKLQQVILNLVVNGMESGRGGRQRAAHDRRPLRTHRRCVGRDGHRGYGPPVFPMGT